MKLLPMCVCALPLSRRPAHGIDSCGEDMLAAHAFTAFPQQTLVVCLYTHTHTRTHAHTRAHTHTHTHTRTHAHTHIYMYIYAAVANASATVGRRSSVQLGLRALLVSSMARMLLKLKLLLEFQLEDF